MLKYKVTSQNVNKAKNVTMKELGKLTLLIDDLDSLNITGLSEVRWSGTRHFIPNEHLIIYIGNEKWKNNSVVIIHFSQCLKSYESNDGIVVLIVNTKLNNKFYSVLYPYYILH